MDFKVEFQITYYKLRGKMEQKIFHKEMSKAVCYMPI